MRLRRLQPPLLLHVGLGEFDRSCDLQRQQQHDNSNMQSAASICPLSHVLSARRRRRHSNDTFGVFLVSQMAAAQQQSGGLLMLC